MRHSVYVGHSWGIASAAVAAPLLLGSAVMANEWIASSPGLYNDPANWSDNIVPSGVGAHASFVSTVQGGSIASGGGFTFDAPVTLGSLSIDMGFAGPGIWFNPTTLTLDNGGEDVTIYTHATGGLEFNGNIVLMGDLVTEWRASNGLISGSISGDYGITQDAAGGQPRLRLWGNNTYTGLTIARNGRISIQDASGLGSHDQGTIIEGNGVLIMENLSNPVISGEHVTLMDGGFLLARPCDWAEEIELIGSGRIAPWFDGYHVTVSGKLTGDGTFIRESAQSSSGDQTIESIVTLSNTNNDYTGGTTIRGGMLRIGDDAVLGQAGTGIAFHVVGFSEGPPSLVTFTDMTTARDISMLSNGWLRAEVGTKGTYSGVISGSRALSIGYLDWTGTVELLGENTYTNGTTIITGTFLVNNTAGSGTGSGNVTVQSGATLGGAGSISGGVIVEADGALAPGNSTGTLSVGSVMLDPAAQTTIELGGTGDGSFDRLLVAGEAALDGELTIVIVDDYEPQQDDSFEIMTAGSVSGAFAEANLPAGFEIEYHADLVLVLAGDVQPACPGDLTGDSIVNVDDLLTVLNNWGACAGGEPGCAGDASMDGVVNVDDLLMVLNTWGACPE